MQMAIKGSFANFKLFLHKGTSLSEDEIMEAIILFHKVQKGADSGFYNNYIQFTQSLNKQSLD
jgi:hypothetical protein